MTSRPELDPELERVRTLFLQLCVRAESMVAQASRSVFLRDPHMARAVVAAEQAADELKERIEALCLDHLSGHRPVGPTLRWITALLKMVTDLDRVAELAAALARRGLELGTGPGLEPDPTLREVAQRVVAMIRLASDAFVSGDPEVHRELRRRDEEVEALSREAFQRGLLVLAEHPDQAARALGYSSIGRTLERIADHAVALAATTELLGGDGGEV